MRYLFIFLFGLSLRIGVQAQGLRYVDAAALTIVNKAQATANPYHRIDTARDRDLTAPAKRYLLHSAGIAVVFRTDSRTIAARWRSCEHRLYNHMTGIAATGLDLYIRRSGEWVPAGFACNRPAEAVHQAVIVEKMDSAEKECLLYLPVMDQIASLEIGVDPGARIAAADNPFRHRIVVLGSSITHGIAASRAGMAYPAQLERRTGLEFINLGISGNCKLDASQARMIAQISADAFVFDCFSNPLGPLIEERLAEFVAIIRAAHPSTPLVFLQTVVRSTGNFNLERRAGELHKRRAAAEGMRRLIAAGDRNLYFLDPGLDPGFDALVDGSHPSDLGFKLITDRLEKQLPRIFRRYDIR